MAETPVSKPSRGLRIALFVSLAVNLLVAGFIGGAVLRGGPDGREADRRDARETVINATPLLRALSREDRRALRENFEQRPRPETGSGRDPVRTAEAILSALRAEDFDAAALDTAVSAQTDRIAARNAQGRATLIAYISGMSREDRLAYADRVETAFRDRKARLPRK